MRRIHVRRNEGQVMAEFALIAPVFLLLVLGIVSFGFMFYYWIAANHAANETARWAIVDQNPYGESLQDHVHDSFPGDNANVCISFENGTPVVGHYLTVKVQKPFGLKIKLPTLPALDMSVTIRGASTMRIEQFQDATGPTAYSDDANIGTCT